MDTAKNRCEHLIVALDVPTAREAMELVNQLREAAGCFKVGIQLFSSQGPDIVRQIQASGAKVFLDLKLHDIPSTVARTVREVASLEVEFLTLHASGGRKMMEAAAAVQREDPKSRLKLLAVTVLTSLEESDIQEVGIGVPLETQVRQLALLAKECGMSGIVCSPRELRALGREDLHPLFFVTPGIRLTASAEDDQRRTLTAAEAIRRGARYIVVGRPILQSSNPIEAARSIVESLTETPRRRPL